MDMTSNRPYVLRALYEWIVDNGLTPHILVKADADNVNVPEQHVQDGRIVLNISPAAVRDLDLGNEMITCNTRFSGTPFHIVVPIDAILAIYAKENGKGMIFPEDDAGLRRQEKEPQDSNKKSHLKIVK